MKNELEAILRTDREFSDYSKQKGAAEAFFEYADEKALMLSKNTDPIKGRLKIKESMAGMERAQLTWAPEDGSVSLSGDIGYTWGRFEFKFEDAEGKEQFRIGKYVSIWKKQSDGKWKWIVDIGNTDDAK